MCKKCKMFFDTTKSLQEHVETTHSKKFKCVVCNFMTYKIKYFIQHLTESKHKGSICSICLYETNSNEELNQHLSKHEENIAKPFFCNDCEKRFPTKRSWSVHLPAHSNETPFLCAVCSKGFKWSQGLVNHMATHTNICDKFYLCDKCDFHTASRANLTKHTLKHYDKKIECPYVDCKQKEIWKENFKAHLLTHSKVKKFQCELCGKSFAQSKNMFRHLNIVHNPNGAIELFCSQCNYFTNRIDKLKDHYKSKHKTYDYTQHIAQLRDQIKRTKINNNNIVHKLYSRSMEETAGRIDQGNPTHTGNMSRGRVENLNVNTMLISNAPPLLKNNIGNIITLPVINQTETQIQHQNVTKVIETVSMNPNPNQIVLKSNENSKQNRKNYFKSKFKVKKENISSLLTKPRKILPLIQNNKIENISTTWPVALSMATQIYLNDSDKNNIYIKPNGNTMFDNDKMQIDSGGSNANANIVGIVNANSNASRYLMVSGNGQNAGNNIMQFLVQSNDGQPLKQHYPQTSNSQPFPQPSNAQPILLLVKHINKENIKSPTKNNAIQNEPILLPEKISNTNTDDSMEPVKHQNVALENTIENNDKSIFCILDKKFQANLSSASSCLQTIPRNTLGKRNTNDDPCIASRIQHNDGSGQRLLTSYQNYMGNNVQHCENEAIENAGIPNTLTNNLIQQHISSGSLAPNTKNNYFDVLDESTGELLLLNRKYINNPFLDEETGELSVFEIPSSFVNYIQNITEPEIPMLLDPPAPGTPHPGNDELNDYSYHDENFDFLLNESISHWPNFSQDSNQSFILNELTGELKVTANPDGTIC